MRSVLAMSLAVFGACCGTRAPAPVAPPVVVPRSERAVAEPFRPPPAGPPGSRSWEVVIFDRRDPVHAFETARRGDLWDPCVRQFVMTRDPAVRNLLGDALSQYPTSCDDPAHRLTVSAPVRTYRQGSYLALVGSLGGASNDVSLVVDHLGAPIEPERITIITDDVEWTSERLDFEANATEHRETASLPYTSAVARVLQRVLDARETVIRLEGPRDSDDLLVTEDMKHDLRMMIEVLEALSPP